ncbi:hypothetical protein OGAPHI_003147 [Ogataea philodendri]|uniref:Uncharacterized protein n=1 Tax=Ogataea philodendri TaxID=1378263 RepID=A0A9P8P8G4_9ASCO|nr:uncharacterized protein OGAPHI_003147 [Ogataea philodendri]KAH3667498.1 hypothetical protein OGAPHI_003147 [Ogataea philodendri]
MGLACQGSPLATQTFRHRRSAAVAGLVLLSVEFGSVNHVGQRSLGLFPTSGLKTTVWVHPELVSWVHLEDLADSGNKLLLRWDSRRVDVEQSQSNVVWIVGELLDVFRIVLLGELDRNNIGVQGLDVVRVKVGVTEVRVDLGVVTDTRGGNSERLSSPLQVVGSLLTSSQWQTFSDGWLVDLDNSDTSSLQVVDLVSQSKGQLQRLHLLGNIVSWERPSQTGNWTGQHTLQWLLGQRLSVNTLLDRHGLWSRNVTNDNRWSNVSGTVGLHPTVGGESVTLQLLTKVLNHVVSLWLTVDKHVQTNFLLESDNLLDLRVDELLVLLSGDLTLGELVSVDSNVLGLWERTDGGGWEQWEVVLGLLHCESLWEWRLSGGQGLVDLGQSSLDSGIVGQVGLLSALDGSSVSLQSRRDVGTRNSLGDGNNLRQFLGSEREPVLDFSVKLLLVLQVDWSVQQGGGGSNNDLLGTNLLDSLLHESNRLGEVVLPDVSTVNNTNGKSLLSGKDRNNLVELLWSSDKVKVETGNWQVLDGSQVWSNVTEVGGQNELWKTLGLGQDIVSGLESGLDLLRQVQNQGWLVDLDLLGTSSSELLQNLGGLCLQVLVNWLLTVQLELGGVGESWSDIVVVRVEPFHHLQSSHVDSLGGLSGLSLQTSTHGEQNVQLWEIELGVSVWNDVEQQREVQDLVVVREVVGRNDVDTGLLLQLPVLLSDLLTNSKELVSTDLASPVGLGVFLELSESSNSWESQNARLNHFQLNQV